MMTFNQRNFDQKIGFYKSNDFSKSVLEYFFDKYLLKTMGKCKEQQIKGIKEEIKEILANMNSKRQEESELNR